MKKRDKEKELAEYFERRKDDPGVWSDKAIPVARDKAPTVVFSIRFTKEELRRLQERAREIGVSVSELIRRAATDEIESTTRATLVARPKRWMVRDLGVDYFVLTSPCTSAYLAEIKTRGQQRDKARDFTIVSSSGVAIA